MKIEISPSVLSGAFNPPPSKSYGHRLAILSCLLGQETTVHNIGDSQDVLATLDCLRLMGANFILKDNNLVVLSFSKRDNITLNCRESGSTLRFLLPVCCALKIKATITGSSSLLSRPTDALINTLNFHGANISFDGEKYLVNGSITAGEYEIDSSVSSQYLSGLLLALSLIRGESKVSVKNNLVSEKYAHITLDCLKRFGIIARKDCRTFYIDSRFVSVPSSTIVEGDFSASAFFLSAGAISNKVYAQNLNVSSIQGDSEILPILKRFGADVDVRGNNVCVSKNTLNGVTIDCSDIPDLVPILAVVSAFASGKTVLQKVERLKFKESDRIKGITDVLEKANIKVEYFNGSLTIFGGKVKNADFNSYYDHRLAMAICILACFADGKSTVSDIACVDKSYPNFIRDFVLLGGKING